MAPTPTPSPARPHRDSSIDAFYIDEEDAAVDSSTQCPFNKFLGLRASLTLENPLDPSVGASVTGRPATLARAETIPTGFAGTRAVYVIFVPKAFRDHPPAVARVSLFYCVGDELTVHGLAHFFDGSPDRVIITVPGRESGWIKAGIAWAIGITSQQIDALFIIAGLAGRKWQVEIMAGYSTGYRGVNGTINNQLVPLGNLKTVIAYDAWYRGDQPAPGGNTALMLKSLAAGVQVVIYDVTSGGTPHPLMVKPPAAAVTIDLKTNKVALWSLIFARVLEKGVKDKYVKPAQVPAAVQTLINNGLPARGTLASSSARKAAATSGTLDDWASLPANKASVATVGASLVNKVYPIIRDLELMAWTMPDAGGIAHAGFIGEFGWEFLARDP